MADWNRMLSKSSGFGIGSSSEEFEEAEVWGGTQEGSYYGSTQESYSSGASSSFSSSAWSLPKALRTIVRENGNTAVAANSHETSVLQRSAPLSIPDWSKIYGESSRGVNGSYDNHEDDNDDEEMCPPHEWIARRLARSQISCFSVVEGKGRTLKGRDMRKVRNGVWKKTGFMG